jgi:hypothetical protein
VWRGYAGSRRGLEFDLIAIDSLDAGTPGFADTLSVLAGAQLLFSGQFHGNSLIDRSFLSLNPSGATFIGSPAGQDSVYHFSVPLVLDAVTSTLSWGYSHLQPIDDEAWAIDNVVVRAECN